MADQRTEIFITAALIVFLGVPHGALDVLYLRRILPQPTPTKFVLLLLAYLAVSAAVVVLWVVSPLLFLLGFLAGAAFHFSGDPEEGASIFTRIAIGAGVVALPSLRHGPELEHLYALLTNASLAQTVVQISVPVGLICLALTTIALVIEISSRRYDNALELIAIGLIATFCSPLLAFTVYFCLMHSARHILRTVKLADMQWRAVLLECVLPMVVVLVAGVIASQIKWSVSPDARVIQIVFVILASLTAPHMILIEPIRLRGWKAA